MRKRWLDVDDPSHRRKRLKWSVMTIIEWLRYMNAIPGPIFELLRPSHRKCIPTVASPTSRIQAPAQIGLQLCFNNSLPNIIFTDRTLEFPIQIAICRGNSRERVTTGPLSTLEVEVLALEGDFDSEDWTKKEFDDKLVRERVDKGPLLVGKSRISLKQGAGEIRNIKFTDVSSILAKNGGKFKLGARVVEGKEIEGRIKEARSDAFAVKHQRGEWNQKHEIPSLGDKIWRLNHIGKKGRLCETLAKMGIVTVQQLLRFLVTDTDHSQLHRIHEECKVQKKKWKETEKHAWKCPLDERQVYMYSSADGKVMLILNCIYQVIEVIFDGCHRPQALESLTLDEKMLVENLRERAYRHQEDIIDYSKESFWPQVPSPAPRVNSIPEPSDPLSNVYQNGKAIQGPVSSTDPPPQGKPVTCLQETGEIDQRQPFDHMYNNQSVLSCKPGRMIHGSPSSTPMSEGFDVTQQQGIDRLRSFNLMIDSGEAYSISLGSAEFGFVNELIIDPHDNLGDSENQKTKFMVRVKWMKVVSLMKWVMLCKNLAVRQVATRPSQNEEAILGVLSSTDTSPQGRPVTCLQEGEGTDQLYKNSHSILARGQGSMIRRSPSSTPLLDRFSANGTGPFQPESIDQLQPCDHLDMDNTNTFTFARCSASRNGSFSSISELLDQFYNKTCDDSDDSRNQDTNP